MSGWKSETSASASWRSQAAVSESTMPRITRSASINRWEAPSLHEHVRLAFTVSLEAEPFIELPGAVDLEHLKPHRKVVSPALRHDHPHKVGTYAASLMRGQQ